MAYRDTIGTSPIEAGRIELETAASELAVSVTLAKTQCRVTHDHEDGYIEHLIKAATARVFSMTRYVCVQESWKLTLDKFPSGDSITLPFAPLASVTSIKYDDEDDTEQTLAASSYDVDTGIWPGRVRLRYDKGWPDIHGDVNSLRIVYVVGHSSVSAVPSELVQAILMAVGHFYRNREDVITGTITSQLTNSMQDLVAPFVVPRLWS